MKKIGAITYHAPYNYGGNLQAYALQEFIQNNFSSYTYEIINFRSNAQKELYRDPLKKKNLKNIIKRILSFNQRDALKKKNELFEKFINEKLNVTDEINDSNNLLKYDENFDFYLCGSDQIWNPKLPDFDWNYFLEFTKSKKKISYAASFGSKKLSLSDEESNRIKDDLKQFCNISVRENSSYELLKSLKLDNVNIHIDPTMLITKDDWESLIGDNKLEEGNYILYYDVKDLKENMKVMEKINNEVKDKVIITRYSGIYSYFTRFKKRFDTGPIEFLNLIKNSKFVVTSSFHGVVFSLLFNKPFLVIDGKKDNRIKDLLENSNLENLNINYENCLDAIKYLEKIDFKTFNDYVKKERKKTLEYFNSIL